MGAPRDVLDGLDCESKCALWERYELGMIALDSEHEHAPLSLLPAAIVAPPGVATAPAPRLEARTASP